MAHGDCALGEKAYQSSLAFNPQLDSAGACFICIVAVLAVLLGAGITPASADTIFTPLPASAHDARLRDIGNGEWELQTTGNDPYFFVKTDGLAIDLRNEPIFVFKYSCQTPPRRMLVFVGSTLDVSHLLTVSNLARTEGWADVSFDLTSTLKPVARPLTSLRVTVGDRPGLVVRLRALHTRSPTDAESQIAAERGDRLKQDRDHADRLESYLKQHFADQISTVSLASDRLHIEGHLRDDPGDLQLAEVPMWQDITNLTSVDNFIPIRADCSGHFTADINNLLPDGRNRLLSAWAVTRKVGDRYVTLSPLHYVDTQTPRCPCRRPNRDRSRALAVARSRRRTWRRWGFHPSR